MTENIRLADLSAPPDNPGQLLAVTHELFVSWFGGKYDLQALGVVLAAAAAERLGGDPPWVMVVSGSGAAKTESIMPLGGAGAVVVSTITGEGALLSGTAKKERAADANGGLLRKVGSRGLLVVKDVTSILAMQRDARAAVLAALREIYDGRWERHVGTDGGRVLSWEGRLVLIGAVTSAWDSAYSVIAAMGDRFVLVRIDSTENRRAAGLQALRNVDHEPRMRDELAKAVGALIDSVDPAAVPEMAEDEMFAVLDLADVVTRARTAVERDYAGNVVCAHAPEMPTRFAKQLAQLARGGMALGMDRVDALALAVRCAGDSLPPLRLSILGDVATHPMTRTYEVGKRLQIPRKTADRVLQELHLLGLLSIEEEPRGESVRWLYSLDESVSARVVRVLTTRRVARIVTPPCRGARNMTTIRPKTPVVGIEETACHRCGVTVRYVPTEDGPGRATCGRCCRPRQACARIERPEADRLDAVGL